MAALHVLVSFLGWPSLFASLSLISLANVETFSFLLLLPQQAASDELWDLPAAAAGSGLLCVGVLWHSHVTAEHLGSIRHSRIYGKQDSICTEKSFWFQNSFKFFMGELETENLGVSCRVLSGAFLLFQNILASKLHS